MAARRGRAFAVLILGWLCGCSAAGGPLTPPASAPQTTADAERSRDADAVRGATGTLLALSRWGAAGAGVAASAGSGPSTPPRAVILAVHGFGDHARSTFSAAAEAWAAAGIATYAYDQRGFGANPSRGYWPGATALVDDLVAVAAEIRARHPCTPLAVLGHSMGGGVALGAGPQLGAAGLADGLVLAAPAIWGGTALNPIHRLAAWMAAALIPERRIRGQGVVRIRPSDNIEAMRQLARDPLYLSPPSAREFLGLVRVVDLAADAAPRTTLPALLLLGARDEIVPEARVRHVFSRLAGPQRTIRYEEGWHLLFRDLQAARVWRDVATWAGELSRPPGCTLAASG